MKSGDLRQVVNFHSVGHVPDTAARALEIVGDEAHLVASLDETLGQLVAVSLHAAELGEGEVGADQNAVFSLTGIWVLSHFGRG